jgi:FixJ family two-component response regulator
MTAPAFTSVARRDRRFSRTSNVRRVRVVGSSFLQPGIGLRGHRGPVAVEPLPRIVLVEDDDSVRKALGRVLAGSGYRVSSFGSAEELLDTLQEGTLQDLCDCLVCDVCLPGASGFELHRRLSGRGAMPPCIFITANDDPAVQAQAERDGDALLLKPFEGRALVALIARSVAAS